MATIKVAGIRSPYPLINNTSGFPTSFTTKKMAYIYSPCKIIPTGDLNQPTPNAASVKAVYPLNVLSSGGGGDGGTVGFSF